MRTPIVIATIAMTLTALSHPQLVSAQKFQEPTKEELQMTSDPKSPGAPAVYLYREEVTDNNSHYVSSYARIKVLTELGKEWATVEVPYTPGYSAPPIIEGRTIHADGTVIPLVGKGADLLAFRTNSDQEKVAVFNLPSVEVGSILEYKWTVPLTGSGRVGSVLQEDEGNISSELASSVPEWEVQTRLFVHKEHFYYNPKTGLENGVGGNQSISHYTDGELASYLLYTQRLPPGVQVAKSPKDDYSLDIQNVPPKQKASNAPPVESLQYRVRFFYTPYLSADLYWENEEKRWSKQVDDFASQSQTIRDAAAQITTGATTPDAKARKIYDAVQALENTDFTRTKSDAERTRLHLKRELKKSEDVWKEKSGSSNDIAALYLALTRAAGLDARGVQAADRNLRIFDPNLLSLGQLDSLLVVLRVDGKEVFLDPGEKLCPYGSLHWHHTLAGSLLQDNKTPIFTPPNLAKDAVTTHSADLTIAPNGTISGTIKVVMNGPEALRWRQLNLISDPAEVQKQFDEALRQQLPQGISAQVDHFQGLDSYSSDLLAVVNVSGHLGSVTGKRILLPAFFFSVAARNDFTAETSRTVPVDLHYAEQVIDVVEYRLPAGFTVESAPTPTQFAWPGHAALVTNSAPASMTPNAPGSIGIKHIYARAFVLLDAKEYPALHDFYQKLATNDQAQLVLTAMPTSAGN
ncbi:DUF3857 domain-containing transglutaminase family protein [Acidicapsa acidisoli]|uniref:DUF3857 domain-containing transglutaminase family protein n=1 Tax=Acidicapsa acidisoli TaxID=1615681 RepID=UPI0021E07C53|nr:DUF3857 and transglutaminase domain-containing protein [Acidicapsa acidisoli]